jgi:hypothetical protein
VSYASLQARVNATALARFGIDHVVNGVTIRGDFVRPGKIFTLGDGMEAIARVPMLIVADGDVPDQPVGKLATCDGQDYEIEETKPDGLGLTVLELRKAPL